MPEVWNTLNKLNENIVYEYSNDTELSLEELEQMEWHKTGEESSNFSSLSAITYVNSDETLAKKVFSDGFVEYYEIA